MADNEDYGYMPLVDPEVLRIAQALERISTAVGGDVTELAIQKAAEAAASALKAEGYAVGEQDGESVEDPQSSAYDPSSPYYHYNAKYYADNCATLVDGKIDEIQDAIDDAEAAIDTLERRTGYVWFDVNNEDGKMYITYLNDVDEDVSFEIDENTGLLMVRTSDGGGGN